MRARPEDVAGLFRKKDSFLLLCHMMPDGDTIGSALALAEGLRSLGKRVAIICEDPVPEVYEFMPGSSSVVRPETLKDEYSISVFLDCTDPARVGQAALEAASRTGLRVNIDHHVTNAFFGDLDYVDPGAAAVGEQVFQIFKALDLVPDISAATCLYVAIATDTGQFCYGNTTAMTHRTVSELLDLGVKPAPIATSLYESRSLSSTRLLAAALATIKMTPCGKVAWIVLTQDMLRGTGAKEAEAEGLINYARSLQGVEVGILFRETRDGQIKVSLRSRAIVDVSEIAASMGGGGHPRAAGCLLDTGIDEAERMVVGVALEAVRRGGGLS